MTTLLDALYDGRAAIRHDLTQTKPYGWVFFHQSRKWIETGRVADAIIPCFPILIDRFQWDLRHISGGGTDLAQWLAEYEQGLRPYCLNAKSVFKITAQPGESR